jgi:hypothetical protein
MEMFFAILVPETATSLAKIAGAVRSGLILSRKPRSRRTPMVTDQRSFDATRGFLAELFPGGRANLMERTAIRGVSNTPS